MDVGLALPQFDYSVPGESPLRWETLARWTRRAEELGFGSVWLADHLFGDLEHRGGPPGHYRGYDPIVTLGALARATSRVRLGTLVLCSPLRPPAVLARYLATIDLLSRGRLIAGIGAGWYEPEFLAAGLEFEPPAVRLARLEEAVAILVAMFRGEPVAFSGQHYEVDGACCRPRPQQDPRPPVWVGGSGDRLLELVARCADGWNTAWTMTLEKYRSRTAVLDAACEKAGRDPGSVTRSLGLYGLVGENEADLRRRFDRLGELSPPGVLAGMSLDQWRRGRLVGTVEQVREQREEWSAAGVSTLIVTSGVIPFAVGAEEDLDMLASAVA